jgi:F-type H+-transporting ATPase subunit b
VRLILSTVLLAAGTLLAQHGEPEHKAAETKGEAAHAAGGAHESGGPAEISIWWKWANFAILAGGIAYFVGKNAPAFFDSRNREIRKGIDEGTALQREAIDRTKAIEDRLKNLETEVEQLRTQAKAEIAAEGDRIRRETTEAIAKIHAHAETEIAAMAKTERAQLKAYAADLAVKLAGDRLREQLTPATDAALVRGFLKGLN